MIIFQIMQWENEPNSTPKIGSLNGVLTNVDLLDTID